MRISDWSSDVCSSDLRPVDEDRMRHHRVDKRAVFEAVVVKTEVGIGRALLAEQVARLDAGTFDQLLDQPPRRRCLQLFYDIRLDPRVEIGRESCRDSV